MELIVNQILMLCDLYDMKTINRGAFNMVGIHMDTSGYFTLHVVIHGVTDIRLLFRGSRVIHTDSLENLIRGLTHILIMSKENPNYFYHNRHEYVATIIEELRNTYVNSNSPTRKSNVSKDEFTF